MQLLIVALVIDHNGIILFTSTKTGLMGSSNLDIEGRLNRYIFAKHLGYEGIDLKMIRIHGKKCNLDTVYHHKIRLNHDMQSKNQACYNLIDDI